MEVEKPVYDRGNPILASVANFIANKRDTLMIAYGTRGGWESWAQIELLMQLRQDHGYNYGFYDQSEITREDQNYAKTQQESDFMIAPTGQGTYIVELKCQSYLSWNKFVPALKADVLKVQKAKLKTKYMPSDIYIIGICPFDSSNNDNKDLKSMFSEYKPSVDHFGNLPWRIYYKKIEFRSQATGKPKM